MSLDNHFVFLFNFLASSLEPQHQSLRSFVTESGGPSIFYLFWIGGCCSERHLNIGEQY